MRTIRVNVTKRDIKYGQTICPCSCPVARAITRHKLGPVFVGSTDATIGSSRISLPKKVTAFIRRFDVDRRGRPFKFKLTIP